MTNYPDLSLSTENKSFFLVFLGYAVVGLFWGSWGALLPAIKVASSISSPANFGLALSCISAGAIPAMVFYGWVVDRVGWLSLTLCFALFGLIVLLISLAHSLKMLVVILLLLGVASGASDVALNTAIAFREAATGRRYFNKAQAAFPFAAILAAPIIGELRSLGLGLNILLSLIAFVFFMMALLFSCYRVNFYRIRSNHLKLSFSSIKRIIRFLIFIGVMGAVIHLLASAVEQWSAIYIEHDLHSSAFMASLGHPVFMSMLFLGRISIHYFGQSIKEWKVLVMTALVAALGLFLVAFSLSPQLALLGFAIIGLGMSSGIPTILSLAGRAASLEIKGTATGIVTTIAYSGYLISPLLVGCFAKIDCLSFSWVVLGFMSIIFSVIILVFREMV